MSVYLTPVTFEGQHPTPSDDGALWAAGVTDGISSGCALSRSGATLTLGAGKFVVAGRTARVEAAKTFSLGASGYDRLVLTVDMSKSVSQRVALDVENSATLAGFPALTQNDINNGGTKYQIVICLIDVSAPGILWTCGRSHSRGYGVQVTLAAADWSSNQQTVYVDGLTAGSNVICTYDPASEAAWLAAGITASSQGDGTLTFTCTTAPSGAVTANILLY